MFEVHLSLPGMYMLHIQLGGKTFGSLAFGTPLANACVFGNFAYRLREQPGQLCFLK